MDWSLDFGTRGKLKTGLIWGGWSLTTLLLWCQAALAGQYSVTYSGGINGVTISPTGYSTWQQNYALVNGWFEGSCSTCNNWYAIEPHDDASSAYGLWSALPFQQFWVRLDSNGEIGEVGSEVAKH